MDDIVTRLRQFTCEALNCTSDEIADEAADEIEQLRAELNNANAMTEAYYQLVQAYKWSHAHLGELPDAIVELVAENYNLKKAVKNGL